MSATSPSRTTDCVITTFSRTTISVAARATVPFVVATIATTIQSALSTCFILSPIRRHSSYSECSLTKSPQVRHNLHNLVSGLNNLGVQLKGSLRSDQVNKLRYRFHVRGLEE